MARLLVRYRDAGAIRWGELEGNPPRQPNEIASVLPLASDAKTTSDIITALDQADVRRGTRSGGVCGSAAQPSDNGRADFCARLELRRACLGSAACQPEIKLDLYQSEFGTDGPLRRRCSTVGSSAPRL